MSTNENTHADWGDRAVHWLRQRYVNWPMKAVARELGESDAVIQSWWYGIARPDRKKLQRLTHRFAREGFSSFVFGAPCRDELHARIEKLTAEIIDLRSYLRSAPARVVSRDGGERPHMDGVQTARKAK